MADRKISALKKLSSPAANDLFVVVDRDESPGADRNKALEVGTLLKNVPKGSSSEPSLSFTENIDTGFYNSGDDQIAITCGGNYKAKFTTDGFQIGNGGSDAPFHLFSSHTDDHVIIECTDSSNGADAAPNMVLFRNSPSAADGDSLGSLKFRGRNDNPSRETCEYAQISARIQDTPNNSEAGILQLSTINNGRSASRITIDRNLVGINETSPQYPLHITESTASTGLCIESAENDSSSAADITLYHHRNNAAGEDNDALSSILFQGNNDASRPEQIVFASISATIIDATDTLEDGRLDLSVAQNKVLRRTVSVTGDNVTLRAPLVLSEGAPNHTGFNGTKGQIAYDEDNFYVCVDTNRWKKVPLQAIK